MNGEQDDLRFEIHQLCRGCVRVGDETTLFPLFVKDSSLETSYIDLIQAFNFINLKIEENDGLPQQICQICIARLSDINKFQKACEKSQDILKEYFLNHLNLKDGDEENEYDELEYLNEYEDEIEGLTNREYEEEHSNDITLEEIDDTSNDEIVKDFEFDTSENVNLIFKNPENTKNVLDILINENNENNKESNNTLEKNEDVISYTCDDCKEDFPSEFLLQEHKCNLSANKIQNLNCQHCEKECANKEALEKHIMKIHRICKICERTFKTAGLLKQHIGIHNPKDTFKCDICNQGFRTHHYLRKHKISVHLKGDFQCKICSMKFQSVMRYKYHLKSHDPNKRFYCKICDKSFRQRTALLIHERKHMHSKFKCDNCKEGFLNELLLKEHKCNLTNKERNFNCRRCKTKWPNKEQLEEHIAKVHNGPHICEICERSFKDVHKLKSHLKVHNPKDSYKCEVCNQGFRTEHYLTKHKKTVHEKGDFQCETCSMKFETVMKLKYHLRSHDPSKQYYCKYCEKSFLQSTHLINHERIHTGLKPFLCNICGKDFNLNDSLKLHLKRHSGVRPFVCNICGQGFYIQYYYKTHMNTHEGTELFSCSFCGKGYRNKLSLNSHVRTHTDMRPFKCDLCRKTFVNKLRLNYHKCTVNKVENEIECSCSECGNKFKNSKCLKAHIDRVHLKTHPHKCNFCNKAFFHPCERKTHEKTHIKHMTELSDTEEKEEDDTKLSELGNFIVGDEIEIEEIILDTNEDILV